MVIDQVRAILVECEMRRLGTDLCQDYAARFPRMSLLLSLGTSESHGHAQYA